jgi:hypothetical protein
MNDTIVTKYEAPASESHDYDQLLAGLRARAAIAFNAGQHLFLPEGLENVDLYETYLSPLEGAQRQYYHCNACRRFIQRFGGLFTVDADGKPTSLVWSPDTGPAIMRPALAKLKAIVESRATRIDGVIVTSERKIGDPVTGDWTHLGFEVPKAAQYKDRLKTADQRAAELKQEAGMLMRALNDFDYPILDTAIALLKTGAVSRADKFVQPVEQLLALKRRVEGQQFRRNLIWEESITAPAGLTHIRGSAVGTLLKNLADGVPGDQALKAFEVVVAPQNYMRPVAPVKQGNIQRAEEVIAKLGLETALQRAMARFEDVATFWKPSQPAQAAGGVFTGLRAPAPAKTIIPGATRITWAKFRETVLPIAHVMNYTVPAGSAHYVALTDAVHQDAPPLLAWDRDEARNRFGWYRYIGGSNAAQWNLKPGTVVPVRGLTLTPAHMSGINPAYPMGVIFLLEGARDTKSASLALLPETLRSDLREVRSTIAAYSNSRDLERRPDEAAGVMVTGDKPIDVQITVVVGTVQQTYVIDRID